MSKRPDGLTATFLHTAPFAHTGVSSRPIGARNLQLHLTLLLPKIQILRIFTNGFHSPDQRDEISSEMQ